jgi:arylsulfatase
VTPYDVDPFELTLREEPVTEEQHERQWESYRACAAYLDDALQSLITEIDWDLLVICSDHGELFGEYGLRQHQYGVYEDLIHVPAVAYGSHVPKGRTDRLISLLDIYQTVLDVADVDDSENGRGVNLFEGERDSVYAESLGNYRASPDAQGIDAKIPLSWAEPHYAYIEGNQKYVLDKDGERVQGLEMGEETSAGIEGLRKRTDQLREGFDTPDIDYSDEENKAVPGEIQDRLEYLGYK